MSYLKKPIEAFLYFILIILLFFLGMGACVGNGEVRTGGPYYFERVEMKFQSDSPLRPVRPISEEVAKTMRAYGIAYYNEQGRITSYIKMLDGETDWSSTFFYSSLGYLEKEEYLGPDKKIIEKYYDKNGQLVKTETGS